MIHKHSFIKKIVTKNETILSMIILMLLIIFGIKAPTFITAENMFDILRSSSFIGVCSIGFLIVLISGGIDISFTATATVAQYLMGLLLSKNQGLSVFVILVFSMSVGVLLGALNAWLINKSKAPAIIITIGTLNLYYGAIQFISNGRWIYDFPEWFRVFPRILLISFKNADGNEFGLSIFTAIWFLIAIIGMFILHKTVLGRKIYALGGNSDAAMRAGININRVRLFCYSFLGGVAGVAAVIHAMITQTVAPNAIINFNFDVLAAVVIGGANIMGGTGTVLGSILGVFLVALLKNGLTILKVPTYWHQVLIGGILLFSVALTAIRAKRFTKKGTIINVE